MPLARQGVWAAAGRLQQGDLQETGPGPPGRQEQAARVSCFCRDRVKKLQNQSHFKALRIAVD
jgi:hypothetical protein